VKKKKKKTKKKKWRSPKPKDPRRISQNELSDFNDETRRKKKRKTRNL